MSKNDSPDIGMEDIKFSHCFKFEMKCPFNQCRNGRKEVIYINEMQYQQHHIIHHQERDNNGELLHTKEAKWKCPECQSVSQSWYNFAAHITIHRELCQPPWKCILTKIKKKKNKKPNLVFCGKTCSTKHNLIKHIRSVHKFNVIEHEAQFLNKKIPKKNNEKKIEIIDSSSNYNKINFDNLYLPTIVAEPPKRIISYNNNYNLLNNINISNGISSINKITKISKITKNSSIKRSRKEMEQQQNIEKIQNMQNIQNIQNMQNITNVSIINNINNINNNIYFQPPTKKMRINNISFPNINNNGLQQNDGINAKFHYQSLQLLHRAAIEVEKQSYRYKSLLNHQQYQ